MYGLLRVLPVCLSVLQTGAQDDQFAPISVDDRIQHFSGVSQSKFQGAPRQPQRQQPQQFQPQQGQFQSQTQQFRPQQQNFQPQQQQNFLPQQQQNFQPQQQQFQSQQQQFQPQQQQFQPQQQQFQPQQQQVQPQQQQFQSQQQQFEPQQQQPLSTEALQESLKQSLQKSLQQQIQSFQQTQPVQEFPPGAQVPNTDLQVQTPEHIRQFQQEVGASQQPKHPFTVFGDPSEPVETQFRKPSTAQFQQQQTQFQQQQPNNFQQQQSSQFQQQLTNQFQQQQPNSFQQPGTSSQQGPSQNPPFTAFSQNQQVAPNGQQSPRSFQSQGQRQFAPELPRSSQQFRSRPQIGAFDQIKTAISTGRRFSQQQVQFPQRQQPITQPPTTTQPPPKFMPLNAVPPGSEQIGTHKKLEDTVINQKSVNIQETKDKIGSIENSEEEISREVIKEKQEKKTPDLEGFIQKVVVQTIAGKKTKEEEKKDQIETAAVVEELNNILELLSKPSSINSKINNIASIKKGKKKPETSLIRIQEHILGLSGISREEESEETRSSNSSEDISELLNLLSKSSKKKLNKTPKSSVSSLQEKILKLSGREDESEDLLTTIKENKHPKEDTRDGDDDLSAVQEALSKLLGSKPAEDSKISPEVFSVVLQLDDFFKEEEKQKSRKVNEVENLIDTALGFIDGAVTRREHAEKRLIDGEPVFDYDDYYGELLDSLDLSPSELRKLLKS